MRRNSEIIKNLTQDALLDLLLSDAQIALTLVESAELTSDDTVRICHIEEAQKRFLMIMLRLPNLSVDEGKLQSLCTHMRLLRNRLVRLGAISER